MKNLSLLIWITQLGASVAFPMAGFTLLGVWLRDKFGWGKWTVAVFCAVGVIAAFDSFRVTLKALEKGEKSKDKPVGTSFNDHK